MINKNKIHFSHGFTLTELLISLGIIGIILVSITIASTNILRRARDTQRISDMQTIETALKMYYQDHGFYPGTCSLPNPLGDGTIGLNGTTLPNTANDWIIGAGGTIDTLLKPYMDTVPNDPLFNASDTSHSFYYAYDPQHCAKVNGSCNCITGLGVVFGFKNAEGTSTNFSQDSFGCSDVALGLHSAEYSKALFPHSNLSPCP